MRLWLVGFCFLISNKERLPEYSSDFGSLAWYEPGSTSGSRLSYCDCGSRFEKYADSFCTKIKQRSVCGAISVHSDASVSMGTRPLRKSLQNTHFLENIHGMFYGPFCLGMCPRSSWSLPVADHVSGDCKFLEHRPVNLD